MFNGEVIVEPEKQIYEEIDRAKRDPAYLLELELKLETADREWIVAQLTADRMWKAHEAARTNESRENAIEAQAMADQSFYTKLAAQITLLLVREALRSK